MGQPSEVAILQYDDSDLMASAINRYLKQGFDVAQEVRAVRVKGDIVFWCVMVQLPEKEGD